MIRVMPAPNENTDTMTVPSTAPVLRETVAALPPGLEQILAGHGDFWVDCRSKCFAMELVTVHRSDLVRSGARDHRAERAEPGTLRFFFGREWDRT